MNPILVISIVVSMAALTQHASAQTDAYDQGRRDGYAGSMSPGASPGWSYAQGHQQGAEDRARDDGTNFWGAPSPPSDSSAVYWTGTSKSDGGEGQ